MAVRFFPSDLLPAGPPWLPTECTLSGHRIRGRSGAAGCVFRSRDHRRTMGCERAGRGIGGVSPVVRPHDHPGIRRECPVCCPRDRDHRVAESRACQPFRGRLGLQVGIRSTRRPSKPPEALPSAMIAFSCCSLAIRRAPDGSLPRTREMGSTWGRTGFRMMSGPAEWRYSRMDNWRSLTTASFRRSWSCGPPRGQENIRTMARFFLLALASFSAVGGAGCGGAVGSQADLPFQLFREEGLGGDAASLVMIVSPFSCGLFGADLRRIRALGNRIGLTLAFVADRDSPSDSIQVAKTALSFGLGFARGASGGFLARSGHAVRRRIARFGVENRQYG